MLQYPIDTSGLEWKSFLLWSNYWIEIHGYVDETSEYLDISTWNKHQIKNCPCIKKSVDAAIVQRDLNARFN